MGLPAFLSSLVPDDEATQLVPEIAPERSASVSLFALLSDLEEAYNTSSTVFRVPFLNITAPYAPVYPLKCLWEKVNVFL